MPGDCNENIAKLAEMIPPHGLNIALLDPYGVRGHAFETIRQLARFPRMDLIVHFPTMHMKRNLGREDDAITRFLGTDSWKRIVKKPGDIVKLIDVLRDQLATFGYERQKVRDMAVRQSTDAVLYHLVYASKHSRGNAIWKSITKRDARRQTDFGF